MVKNRPNVSKVIGLLLLFFSLSFQTLLLIAQELLVKLNISAFDGIFISTILGLTGMIFVLFGKNFNLITEEKQKSEKQCRTERIVDTINEGVVVANRQGEIVLFNPEAQSIADWHDDAIGLDVQVVLNLVNAEGEIISEEKNPIILAIQTKTPQESSEFFVQTIQKNIKPVRVKVNLSKDQQEVIIVLNDISKEVAKSQSQLEFISTASHEMRTPVAAIDGYLSLILNPKICNIDTKAAEYASKAKISSQHLGELFKNLLDVSKMEDGRVKPNLEVIDLIPFLAEIYQTMTPIAKAKGLNFIFIPEIQSKRQRGDNIIFPHLYIHSDKNLLAQAVMNLIENAIKYTPNGKVEIDFEQENPDTVTIKVKDTGIGIPENNLKHIFQKFYRVDNSDTREINGTGLGLYLTKQIVETLNGKIRAESELGKGSTFFIILSSLTNKKAKALQDLAVVKPDQTTEANIQPETVQVEAEPILTTERTMSVATAEHLKTLGYSTDSYEIK